MPWFFQYSFKKSWHEAEGGLGNPKKPWHGLGILQFGVVGAGMDTSVFGGSNSVPERPRWLIWTV